MEEAGYNEAWLGCGLEWAVGSSLLFSSPAGRGRLGGDALVVTAQDGNLLNARSTVILTIEMFGGREGGRREVGGEERQNGWWEGGRSVVDNAVLALDTVFCCTSPPFAKRLSFSFHSSAF